MGLGPSPKGWKPSSSSECPRVAQVGARALAEGLETLPASTSIRCPNAAIGSHRLTSKGGDSNQPEIPASFAALACEGAYRLEIAPTPLGWFESLPSHSEERLPEREPFFVLRLGEGDRDGDWERGAGVRGGLPVFEARGLSKGIPYIHSTSIRAVVADGTATGCGLVRPIQRGVVAGHVILLPRVGVPQPDLVRPIYLARKTQLSDCVVAIKLSSRHRAETTAKRIRENWSSLIALYRGTGARYVTVARLGDWLARRITAEC